MDGRSEFRGPRAVGALLLGGAVAGLLAACAGAGGPVAGPGDSSGASSPAELPHLRERAALLYLVDRQIYEPVLVRRGLAGPPELRRETALALGRIGDPGGLETLYSLLVDEVPEVRREAAFALGEVAEAPGTNENARTRAAARLLEAVDDPDRDTGRLAVEALGKAGVAVEQVASALDPLPDDEARARLLPALFRYPEPAAVPLAAEGLAAEEPELRRWAAYALTRRPRPEALPWIRELVADPDPRVRAWAARAIGLVGGGDGRGSGDLAALRLLLSGLDGPGEPGGPGGGAPGPAIQALRAARALIADGRAAPDPAWRERLLELFADPRPGVRVTALDAASAWLLDEELGAALAAVTSGERPGGGGAAALEPPGSWERGTALVALATGGDPRAEGLAASAARAADPWLRARAAEAAGVLGARHLLDDLAADREPRVRQAAGAARLALAAASSAVSRGSAAEPPAAPVARELLADPDPGVRAAALGWLAERPVLSLDELETAVELARRSPVVEERLAAVDALAARAEAEAGERGGIVSLLESLAIQADRPTRARAAEALERLGRPRPPAGPAEADRPLGVYSTILLQTAEPKVLAVTTERGDLQLRLACPDVPLTCLSLLQLVRQGFYDGLVFHRVVPDFAVQGGDPRGDGWGGPGYTLRDEIHRKPFRRGTVGLALAGPDTGGSQLFVALSPQPHLDGAYTAVGEVIAGEEVLDRIRPGDRILEVREVEPTRRRR